MLLKKLALIGVATATLALVACGGEKKPATTEQKPAATEAVEQQAAIDASKIDAAPVEGPVAPNPNAPADTQTDAKAETTDTKPAEETKAETTEAKPAEETKPTETKAPETAPADEKK